MPIYKQNKKKDGKQQYRVIVNYTDRTGQYRQKTKTIYGAAEAADLERRMQLQISQTVPDASIILPVKADHFPKIVILTGIERGIVLLDHQHIRAARRCQHL